MASKSAETKTTSVETTELPTGSSHKATDGYEGPTTNSYTPGVGVQTTDGVDGEILEQAIEVIEEEGKKKWYAYLTTWDFWIILILGQVLCVLNTATSTFSSLLVERGTSIPAFQTLFNYILLFLMFCPYTIYRYGWRKYGQLMLVDGWKYICLSFLDTQGNYFTVLAYRYTTILSAQLLNFWSIVCVVLISFFLLSVRYKWPQIAGILLACGGMGILLASDHITGSNGGYAANELKGDLFALGGATFYGLSNVFEEWFVSKRPIYEVLGMLGLFGMLWNGGEAGIFDRSSFASATWNGPVIGYVVGYTLCLTVFYSLAPFILRMASAAFFDISLLTGNFWGLVISVYVFGYSIHWMYPIAFVLIILGLFVYFLAGSMLGDARKPWLGRNQEEGVTGWGTAKWKALRVAEREGRVGRAEGAAV